VNFLSILTDLMRLTPVDAGFVLPHHHTITTHITNDSDEANAGHRTLKAAVRPRAPPLGTAPLLIPPHERDQEPAQRAGSSRTYRVIVRTIAIEADENELPTDGERDIGW